MTWWGWILFGGYVACALVALRKIAWVAASDLSIGGRIGGDDLIFGLFIGTIVCMAWPLIWTGYMIHQREGDTNYGALLSPPKRIRRREEMAMRDRRIRELEREVGISDR